jgi:tripartite-type tricarboxylate transporter receptor subunit TctC
MSILKKSLLAFALIASAAAAQAQAWPNKPIRFVVPFPAAGPVDLVGRSIGQAIGPGLGTQVIVDNRVGAFGTIGSDAVAKSPPDGYTALVMVSGGHSLTPAIMNLKYDPLKDLPVLLGVARSEHVLVTGAKNKGMSLQDFIKSAKASPGKVNVGGIGTGSTNHLAGEMFQRQAGFTGLHVPYNGASPLALAVMSGEVDLAVIDMGGVLPHIAAGNLVPLAVASTKRSEFLPNAPTTAEAGFPNLISENVYGIFLPAGVPKEVQAKLSGAIVAAVGTPAVQEQLRKAGLVPQVIPRADLEAMIKSQHDKLVPLAQELKIRLD